MMNPPPPTLTIDANAIINECEMIEMSPTTTTTTTTMMTTSTSTSNDEMVASIHMAALLYLGEVGHARHLWKRSSTTLIQSKYLMEWYDVGCAMMVQDYNGAIEALHICQTHHPFPLNHYAVEVEQAMTTTMTSTTTATTPSVQSWSLWSEELVDFLEQQQQQHSSTSS